MVRHAAAIALVLFLSPASVYAQTTALTVNAASANVYMGPSTGSAVIGHAPRGAVLEVTRELGSWVKVSWPSAQDGVGYLHVSAGSISHGQAAVSAVAVRRTAGPSAQSAPAARAAAATQRPTTNQIAYVTPLTHSFGVGGLMSGSTLGFGASARAWSRDRLGFQLQVARYATTDAVTTDRLSSTQLAPSVLYSWRDHVTESVSVRPYMGGGVNWHRQTLSLGPLGVNGSISDNGLGAQTFGGAEMTFPAAPRFGVSVDVGYRWAGTPFPAYDLSGMGIAVSGHWYLK